MVENSERRNTLQEDDLRLKDNLHDLFDAAYCTEDQAIKVMKSLIEDLQEFPYN